MVCCLSGEKYQEGVLHLRVVQICSQHGINSFFSDLYSGLESVPIKFADNANLRGVAMYLEGKISIQMILIYGRNGLKE